MQRNAIALLLLLRGTIACSASEGAGPIPNDATGSDSTGPQGGTSSEPDDVSSGSSSTNDPQAPETAASADASTSGGQTSETTTGDESTGGASVPCPEAPDSLARWLVGNDADADVSPAGPSLVMMGGGPDVDAAFVWWRDRLSNGDVVVLRATGEDGYNDYLFTDIGGADSVETLRVDSATLADDPYVVCRIAQAEGVFLAGGDQSTYMTLWKDHGVGDALMQAWDRGAVLGGTSAGLAVLGEFVFGAYNDTVYSDEALGDPYNRYMTMDQGMLALAPLVGVVTDTHFAQRDRMGRLLAFVARIVQDGWADTVMGIGVDEATALLVDADGSATVVGEGSVYVLRSAGIPQVCAADEPLCYAELELVRLQAGDAIALPAGTTDVPATTLSAFGGALDPADPY